MIIIGASDLIPLCHPLMLTSIKVDFDLVARVADHQEASEVGVTAPAAVKITARCKLAGRTGVEMEALTAASTAALTIYDMCKALEKSMVIGPICLIEKSGGKSGDWVRTKSD